MDSDNATLIVTNSNDNGTGSLRQAIIDANAQAGSDKISFDASLSGQSILLTSGELRIDSDLTIDGDIDDDDVSDITIDANRVSRVFSTNGSSNTVLLQGLTIQNGRGGEYLGPGGGGILNTANLTIANSTIQRNSVEALYGLSGGGGISSHGGTLTIVDSTISDNTSKISRRGAGGGGISGSNITIINSKITGNSTLNTNNSGGGIRGFDVMLIDSIVSGNSTSAYSSAGGGISGSDITLKNSVVSNNFTARPRGSGGGIHASNITVTNSTISGNAARGTYSRGGGIYGSGEIEITNSTIASNITVGYEGGGGGVFALGSKLTGSGLTIQNSIISDNTAVRSEGEDVRVFYGVGIAADSLLGDNKKTNSEAFVNLKTSGNITATSDGTSPTATDDIFTRLAFNGDRLPTHALVPGSPAIDAGNNSLVPADTTDQDQDNDLTEPVPFDQRGPNSDRIENGVVDIGAFEFQLGAPVAVNDSFVTDEDTLIQGNLLLDNGNGVDKDLEGDPISIILVDSIPGSVGSEIALSGGLLTVNADGTFVFDPAGRNEALIAGQSSIQTFTYTISDGALRDRATVDVTINGLDDDFPVIGKSATIFVNVLNTVSGNALQAGETYKGFLSSNTDGTNNPNDVIQGTSGDDNIFGGMEGSDLIAGAGGNDIIGFGTGDADVNAGRGDDFVYAAAGAFGSNKVDLGDGTDSFYSTGGNNNVTGRGRNIVGIGIGNDTVTTFNGDDVVYSVNGGGGNNVLRLGNGNNTVWVQQGNYRITTGLSHDVIGLGSGVDVVKAGDGDNVVYSISRAGGRKDIVTGAGDDYIQTSAGDDLIDGGMGLNTLLGGTGADRFTLRGDAYNFLGDFELGVDSLVLEGLAFDELSFFQGTGEVAADAFVFLGLEAIAQVANTSIEALSDRANFA